MAYMERAGDIGARPSSRAEGLELEGEEYFGVKLRRMLLRPRTGALRSSWSYDGWNKADAIVKLAGAFGLNKDLA
jgi:hypothetical protein